MKVALRFFALLLCYIGYVLPICAQVQNEDVIYLKNGNIYRGTISEQIPGESYTIEIMGGSVLKIKAEYIERITHEKKANTAQPYLHNDESGTIINRGYTPSANTSRRHPPPFIYRQKGYFFQAQIMLGFFEIGLRIINGYKFGQFGYLGLGVGVDGVIAQASEFSMTNGVNVDYAGPHFPIFLYYTGDILKRRITPFYAVEVGYAFRVHSSTPFASSTKDPNQSLDGGMTGGIGFGVRFFSRKSRVNVNLSINLDIKNPTNTFSYLYNNGGGQYLTKTYSTTDVMYFPAFKFGIGF